MARCLARAGTALTVGPGQALQPAQISPRKGSSRPITAHHIAPVRLRGPHPPTNQHPSIMRLTLLCGCLLLAVSTGFQASAALGVSGYNCPDTCTEPKCQCPLDSPPGGLSASDVPQFILFTVGATLGLAAGAALLLQLLALNAPKSG